MEIIVRAAAVAALAVFAVGFVIQLIGRQFRPPEAAELGRNFTMRGLAMELAQSPADVALVLQGPDGSVTETNRRVMRRVQAADLAFIAAYWLLFTLASVLLAERRFPMATGIAVVAGIFSTIAAVCDVWEDVFIVKVTRSILDSSSQPLIDHCRTAALWKWNLLFLAMILLSSLFLGRTDWRSWSGVVLTIPGLLIALAGVGGMIMLPAGGAVEKALTIMFAGLAALTIAFIWGSYDPDRFLGGL
jgi:hypothetical protein